MTPLSPACIDSPYSELSTNRASVTSGGYSMAALESPAGGRSTMKLDAYEEDLLDSVEHSE